MPIYQCSAPMGLLTELKTHNGPAAAAWPAAAVVRASPRWVTRTVPRGAGTQPGTTLRRCLGP